MPFNHFVIISAIPMAWESCHCKATVTHYRGEERGDIPVAFYANLREGVQMDVKHMRVELSKLYGAPWKARVAKMKDNQVLAVYRRLKAEGKL
jgi:hypothetical protein